MSVLKGFHQLGVCTLDFSGNDLAFVSVSHPLIYTGSYDCTVKISKFLSTHIQIKIKYGIQKNIYMSFKQQFGCSEASHNP